MSTKKGGNHVKPTKEELEANAQKAADELDKMDEEKDKKSKKEQEELDKSVEDVETEEEQEEEVDEEEEKDDESDEDDADDDSEEDDSDDDSDEASDKDDDEEDGEEEEQEEDNDKDKDKDKDKKPSKKKLTPEETEKKLKASTREAQILFERNRQVQEAIKTAAELPEPTNEEMKKEFPKWDTMTDFEKRMAKDNITNNRRLKAVTEVTKSFEELEQWKEKVDEFIEDPATIANNPDLDGREEEFKIFVGKPTRRGVSFDVLVGAFLHQLDETKKKTPKKKGKMFEQGSGGHKRTKPKKTKLSASEAGRLRKTNFKKFKELLKTGKIDPTDI